MSCSAFGCTKRPSKDSTVQFFRFPLGDNDRLKRWLLNVRRKNWTPSRSSRLCSSHFEEDQFFTDKKDKRRLKDTAVPTIFNFPLHLLKKKEASRATRTKRVSIEVSDILVSHSVPSCSAPAEPPAGPRPAAPLCSVWKIEAVTDFDNGNSSSIPSFHHINVIVKQEPEEMDVADCVHDYVKIEVHDYVKTEVHDDVKTEVHDDVKTEVHDYVKTEVHDDVKTEVHDDIKTEVHDDIKTEVHDDIKIDVHADVDEVATDDMTEYTTSGDLQTIMHDHSYLSTSRKQIPVCVDHSYIGSESPRALRRKVTAVQNQLLVTRKKLKLKCQQTRRMKSKLLFLKDLTKVLQKQLRQQNHQQHQKDV
ncbi:hypothetical protein PAMA_014624 [Pampus argenteus]